MPGEGLQTHHHDEERRDLTRRDQSEHGGLVMVSRTPAMPPTACSTNGSRMNEKINVMMPCTKSVTIAAAKPPATPYTTNNPVMTPMARSASIASPVPAVIKATPPFEHHANLDRHAEDAHHGEQYRDTGIESQRQNVGCCHGAKTTHDGSNQPIERCGNQPQPLIPDSRQAPLGGARCDTDRLIRGGSCPEGMHDHGPDTETAGHEEVGQIVNSPCHPRAQDGDADQIDHQHDNINPLHHNWLSRGNTPDHSRQVSRIKATPGDDKQLRCRSLMRESLRRIPLAGRRPRRHSRPRADGVCWGSRSVCNLSVIAFPLNLPRSGRDVWACWGRVPYHGLTPPGGDAPVHAAK